MSFPADAPPELADRLVRTESRSAGFGQGLAALLIVSGLALVVIGSVPGLQVTADFGLPILRIFGFSVHAEVPIGLVLVVLGIWMYRQSRPTIEVTARSKGGGPQSSRMPKRKRRSRA